MRRLKRRSPNCLSLGDRVWVMGTNLVGRIAGFKADTVLVKPDGWVFPSEFPYHKVR